MPRGDKSRYTPAQKRKARRIEESYEGRGLDEREAAARAWATVNKQTGGGERSGGGRHTSAKRKTQARKDSARRAVASKHGHSPNRGRLTARRSHHAHAVTGLALAVLLACGLGAPARAAAATDQPQPHSDSMSAAVSDTATTARVKARFAGDKRMDDISVHTTNGVVTLGGTAASRDDASAARDAAKSVTGVKSVDNSISVPGARGELGQAAHETGRAVSDGWITTKIKTQLKTNHSVERSSDISVSTANGVVTLSGTASSRDVKDQAEAIARNVKGVKSVDASSLRLASSE